MSETKKAGFFTAAADAFHSKYTLLSVIGIVAALCAALTGGATYNPCLQITAAAVILLLTETVQNTRLARAGITRKDIKANYKALDPRLRGAIDDAGGLAAGFGAFAAVVSVLADLFVVNGGAINSENFGTEALLALARGLSVAASFTLMASSNSLYRTLYLTVSDLFPDDDPMKIATKAAHYEGIVKIMQGVCSARIAMCISLTAACSVIAFSGIGFPITCIGAAFISGGMIILTENIRFHAEPVKTEKKHSLWTSSGKSFCTFSTVVFLVVSLFFMFSFPIQSVFTRYTPLTDFVYDMEEEFDTSIHALSVPDRTSDTEPLFIGYFMLCMIAETVTAAIAAKIANSESLNFVSRAEAAAALFCLAAASAYVVVTGIVQPASALDAVMWVVELGFLGLLSIIYFIFMLTLKNKEKEEN